MNSLKEIRNELIQHAKVAGSGIYKTSNVTSNLNWLRIKRQVKECCKYIPRNARVLDVGCGLGHNTKILKIFRPDIIIVGIDPDARFTWKKFKSDGCEYKTGNAMRLDFEKNYFDVIVSFGVMEHIRVDYNLHYREREFRNEDLRFMKEICRVLKPGGVNIITNLPNRYSWVEFISKFLGIRTHSEKYTKKQIEKLIKRTKFKKSLIRLDFFIPAQVYKFSKFGGRVLNVYFKIFDKLDHFLNKTPLNLFSHSYFIICKKLPLK